MNTGELERTVLAVPVKSEFQKEMMFKIMFWMVLWALTWALVMFSSLPGTVRIIVALLGIVAQLFIALNIGHDANHNSITSNPLLAAVLRRSFDLIGISSFCWRLNHNRLHHPYTSIPGIDTTADGKRVMRFNDAEEKRFHHRFQHLYAPLAYGLVTLNYIFCRDFLDFYKLFRKPENRKKYGPAFGECVLFKAFYLTYMIALPLLVLPYSSAVIISTFLAGHFLIGQIIILIQVPHFNQKTLPVSESDISPDSVRNIKFILRHTSDIAPDSKFWNWLLGGTNTHVIHHILPGVSHVHYVAITRRLRKFCETNELHYNSFSSVSESYASHYRYLKLMGGIEK